MLALDSKITIGKLAGCRICDCIEDNYEYLLWAEKSGLLKYTQEVKDKINSYAQKVNAERFYREEVAPWADEDVPF